MASCLKVNIKQNILWTQSQTKCPLFLLSLAGGQQGRLSMKPIRCCGCRRVSISVNDVLPGLLISGFDLFLLEG